MKKLKEQVIYLALQVLNSWANGWSAAHRIRHDPEPCVARGMNEADSCTHRFGHRELWRISFDTLGLQRLHRLLVRLGLAGQAYLFGGGPYCVLLHCIAARMNVHLARSIWNNDVRCSSTQPKQPRGDFLTSIAQSLPL